ncbi:hypothetical protein D5086_032637, partial [Populus alba]
RIDQLTSLSDFYNFIAGGIQATLSLYRECRRKNVNNPKMKKTIHPREREEKQTSVSLSVLSPQV